MKIGELAIQTGVGVETIRHYEREGLMPPPARSESNYRVYDAAHAQQLSLIRHCRGMDMSLQEIRTLLHFRDNPLDNCGQIDALLDTHLDHVSNRIRELRALEKQLKDLRQLCQGAQDAQHCGILSSLTKSAANGAPVGRSHLRGTH
ncbi:MAG: Cd(II)/Pb(II)-responsive transcriptional regulator [Rhodoferax sp.]|nr:Cd(II)/Pb(II)-responsive transcriptional regulator [Rhodoferax sp.]